MYDVIFMIGGTMDRQFEPQTVGERIKFLREKMVNLNKSSEKY